MLPSSCLRSMYEEDKERRGYKMSIKKFNHVSPFTYQAGKDFQYYTLKQIAESTHNWKDKEFPLMALYINNKSRYGAAPVAVCDGFYVNLPSHLLDVVRSIMADPEVVSEINEGKCGFKIRAYQNSQGGESYTVEWIDLASLPY